jgi:hypothetical protein
MTSQDSKASMVPASHGKFESASAKKLIAPHYALELDLILIGLKF